MKKTKKFFFEKAQGACKRGTAAVLCIVLILLFAAGSCEKPPEKGIKYHDNVVGAGHVFLRYSSDSLVPLENAEVEVESAVKLNMGMGGIVPHHEDYVTTNREGQYICRFVKSIDGSIMKEYSMTVRDEIYPSIAPEGYIFRNLHGVSCTVEEVTHSTGIIFLDTLFYELREFN
ncbi:MAG: hypothetical protein LBK03_03870 [Bacteroidales bacterium]|jgi:hypothetical protein|nr:hypothetical protein [Bacteroidales bacterium]